MEQDRTNSKLKRQRMGRIDPAAEVEHVRRARRAAIRRRAREAVQRAAQHEPDPAHDAVDNWHFSVEKTFVHFSYLVAIALVIVFGLDMLTGIPFRRASILFDVTNVIGGIILAYLSWNTHCDLV